MLKDAAYLFFDAFYNSWCGVRSGQFYVEVKVL